MNLKRLKSLMIFLISLIVLLNVKVYYTKASNNEINFNRMTIDDGLSQGSVQGIVQDKHGYMWFATGDGLNKYNGKEFKVYKYNKNDIYSLSESSISSVVEDYDGQLWVGTINGLNRFNPETETNKRYNLQMDSEPMYNNNVTKILMDNDGKILIGTENGLVKYDRESDKFKKINIPEMEKSIESSFVNDLCEDKLGQIWIATKSGVFVYNKESDSTKVYMEEKNGLSCDDVYKILEDNIGRMWMGTRHGGLNLYNKDTNEFKVYKCDNNNDNSIASNTVQSIFKDSNNKIWIGTTGGLCSYNEIEDNFKRYVNNMCYDKSIIDNNIKSIYQDKSGAIWVGTVKGISVFNPKPLFNHYRKVNDKNSISNNFVTGIYKDKEGLLWIGTVNDGLNVINRDTGEVINIKYDENNENSISDNRILEIVGDKDDNIWIATNDGLNKYNKKDKKFTRFKTNDSGNSIISNEIRSLFVDNNNILWIGTHRGIDSLDLTNEKFTNYNKILIDNGVDDKNIVSIYGDDHNNMWFGSAYYGGLIRFNKENSSIKSFRSDDIDEKTISNNGIRDITEDKEGNMWIATMYGLNKFDPKSEIFTRYTEDEGLSNNYTYGVLIDEFDNPWVSTNYGLCRLDKKDNVFSLYSVSDGLQGNEFNGSSAHKSYDDELFFGGTNGLNSFYAKDIEENTSQDKVIIDEFKVYDKKINIQEKIELKYNSNYFSIDFFVPSYNNVNSIKYAYMLEGVDKEWIYTNNRQHVTYTNIDGGNYKFKVKAKTNRGTWSDETQLDIEINNPPWKSVFAYNLYIILALIIAFIIWNYVKILENLVKQRTKELNNKLDENKILYSKLLSQEKYKNDYFVNLSHELRTPLNVILSTVQLINNFNKGEIGISKEHVKKYMKIINKNSNSLLRIITDIIDTSKMEAGSYKINCKNQDIVYIVEEISLSMKSYIESNGVELIVDPEIEEKIIWCDDVEIERCVVNLISNAVKFTPDGGTITVNIYDKENYIEIHVKDTGTGISDEDQKLIFQRFKQANNQKESRKGGSGIGLALVKSIVELHGGSISVESKLNEGSDFIIKLPIKNIKE